MFQRLELLLKLALYRQQYFLLLIDMLVLDRSL